MVDINFNLIMTPSKAIQQIKSNKTPYKGIMPSGQFYTICKRIEAGTITIQNMTAFFAKFGYELEINLNKQQIEIQ